MMDHGPNAWDWIDTICAAKNEEAYEQSFPAIRRKRPACALADSPAMTVKATWRANSAVNGWEVRTICPMGFDDKPAVVRRRWGWWEHVVEEPGDPRRCGAY